MATPTITRLSRASGAYFQNVTGAAYDVRVSAAVGSTGVHVYEVTLADGESATYEELFTAIGNHADWTVSITTSGNSVDGTEEPSRIINISNYGVGGHSGIILLKSGRYFHEIAGSTYVNFSSDQMLMPLLGCLSSIDATGSNASQVGITYGIDTTGASNGGGVSGSEWNATHEITLGSVRWRQGRRCFQFARDFPGALTNGAQRAVDWGDPKKIAEASALALATAAIGPAAGQTMRVTNNRLIYECASGSSAAHNTERQDFDITGDGLVDVDMTWRRIGNALSYMHTTNSNPNSNILVNTLENLTVSSNSQTWKYTGAPEAFSTLPDASTHPYLDTTNMRGTSPFESTHRNLTGLMGKYFAAFVGDSRFAPAAGGNSETGVVLQGLKSSGIQYFKDVFAANNHGDLVWLDPPFIFTTNNTPTRRNENTVFGIHYLRSVGVNNRDASSSPKNSTAFVVGYQESTAHQAYESNTATFWNARVPPIRTAANGGTWSVRGTDTAGTGLEGVVGRGVHYLFDAAMDNADNGDDAADYVRASTGTGSANDSYLVHRGGIHRYSTDINIRNQIWNLNSNGASGALFNNDVDDVPGLTDNLVNMYKDGLTGTFTGTGSLISGASGSITMDGFTNLTQHEVNSMVGASLVGVSGHGEITAATRTNATTVVLTVTASSSGISYTNDVSGTVYWDGNSGYRWTLNTTNNREILITIPANEDIVWSYSQLAALIQAKIEKVIAVKQQNMGSESAVFGSGNDSTYGGSNIAVNTLLETLLAHATTATDKSFMSRNTTTGTTLDIHRVLFSVNTSSTLTLNPDEFITLLNYGSSFTVPARVTHNGSYTDSNGTPNFIDIALPTGIATTDVKFAVSYQNVRPLATYISYAGILSGAIDFDTNGTLVSGEWQAVTRPSATGSDTILDALPTSWDWSPETTGSVQRVIMRQDSSLTSALRTTLQTWINGSETNYVVAANADLSSYAIYEGSEASLQGSAVAMNLRLITSTGVPVSDDVTWYFNVNSSGAAVTNVRSGGNWTTGATPTITSANNRTFLQILESESNGAATNETGVWTLGIAGGKINPVRQQYTGNVPAGTTITLTADALRPASSAVTKSGNITVVPYSIASPGSNSEVKTLLTENVVYPNDQINAVTRLGLFINGYNSATDAARTQIDVGDALNSTVVAKYVGVYGTGTVSDIVRVSDANLTDTHWRIRYDGVSQVDFLKMDGLLPTTVSSNANYFEVDPADDDAVCFFNAPEYSAAEVQGLVEATINTQTEDLTGLLSNVSLGIPV